MATGDVAIVNSALGKLGCERIISLDDDSDRARIMKAQYPLLRDKLLRSHPWNFAIKRVSLAALSDAPAFGYDYQYQLPSDCLRILETSIDEADWQKEGDVIVTNESSLAIKYLSNDVPVGLFDACFCEVLALDLAIDTCHALTTSNTRLQSLAEQRKQEIQTARSFDAQEGAIRQVQATDWRNARR